MALSMDEQRILDEMERKLAGDDPLLASRLTSFGRPGVPQGMSRPERGYGRRHRLPGLCQ